MYEAKCFTPTVGARTGQQIGQDSTHGVHTGAVVHHTAFSYFFTARRNARIASAVLAIAIPSVCPSVTRRYCVKTTARSTMQFALSDSTRRPASADRTARRQFKATGQPVSRTQAIDAMTSRLPRDDAKCVQRTCFQCGPVPLRSDIKGTELPLPIY